MQAQTKYNSKFNISEAFQNFKLKQDSKAEDLTKSATLANGRKQAFNLFLSNDKPFNGASTMRTRVKDSGTTPVNIFQTYLKQSTLASPIQMDRMLGGDNFCDIDTVDDFFDFQKKPESSQTGKETFRDKLQSFKSDFNNMLVKAHPEPSENKENTSNNAKTSLKKDQIVLSARGAEAAKHSLKVSMLKQRKHLQKIVQSNN